VKAELIKATPIQLGMPFTATPTGLVINGNPSLEECREAARALAAVEGALMWCVGDLAAYAEREYGDLKQLAEDFGVTYGSARVAAHVSSSIELLRRLNTLSFSHHQAVASLSIETQNRLLGEAESENLTLSQLRQRVRALNYNANIVEWPIGKYAVIYADPDWQYSNDGFRTAAAEKYPTSITEDTSDELAANIDSLAADETVLFMWATSPLLPLAMQVIDGSGFEYVSSMVWKKNNAPPTGWWPRVYHELLLIGRRCSTPKPLTRPASVVEAPVGKHSAKPAEFYDLIEEMYPLGNGTHIELFARKTRPGWAAFGNQL
jgi:N6-adenosine-specific RNA methylase IME4